MLNYSKFVYRSGKSAPSTRVAGKPVVKPAPAFQIEAKTPKVLKGGLERMLKKVTPTERKLLNKYVRFVLYQYEQKLGKKYKIPTRGLALKFPIKDRIKMAKIMKKLGRSVYYLDKYVKVLKYKLAKKYKDLAKPIKGRAWGNSKKNRTKLKISKSW